MRDNIYYYYYIIIINPFIFIAAVRFVDLTRRGRVFHATSLLRQPTVVHAIEPPQLDLTGVAALGNELFLCGLQSEVKVYKFVNNRYTLSRQIEIPESHRVLAMIACSQHQCLYVSVLQISAVALKSVLRRFDIIGNSSSSSSSSWSLRGRCWGLSVSPRPQHSLLVTLQENKRLVEYTTRGRLIREIRLYVGGDSPYHGAELSNGNFVITLIGLQHRVCIVDQAGCILYSYGGAIDQGYDQLVDPYQLAVDEWDNVLVINFINRVELLNPTLRHLGYIEPPGHRLRQPHALHLDVVNRCLYVGSSDGSIVMIKANLLFKQ